MAVSKRNKFSVYMLGICLLLETVAFVCVTVIQVGELAVNFITHLNTAKLISKIRTIFLKSFSRCTCVMLRFH